MVSRPSGGVDRVRLYGVSRGTCPDHVTRTQRVWLAFAMGVYGVAVIDRHGDVGHWFTGPGSERDQCDRNHYRQCLHLVFFLVGWRANSNRDRSGRTIER
jgi:hypothetical protein